MTIPLTTSGQVTGLKLKVVGVVPLPPQHGVN